MLSTSSASWLPIVEGMCNPKTSTVVRAGVALLRMSSWTSGKRKSCVMRVTESCNRRWTRAPVEKLPRYFGPIANVCQSRVVRVRSGSSASVAISWIITMSHSKARSTELARISIVSSSPRLFWMFHAHTFKSALGAGRCVASGLCPPPSLVAERDLVSFEGDSAEAAAGDLPVAPTHHGPRLDDAIGFSLFQELLHDVG